MDDSLCNAAIKEISCATTITQVTMPWWLEVSVFLIPGTSLGRQNTWRLTGNYMVYSLDVDTHSTTKTLKSNRSRFTCVVVGWALLGICRISPLKSETSNVGGFTIGNLSDWLDWLIWCRFEELVGLVGLSTRCQFWELVGWGGFGSRCPFRHFVGLSDWLTECD